MCQIGAALENLTLRKPVIAYRVFKVDAQGRLKPRHYSHKAATWRAGRVAQSDVTPHLSNDNGLYGFQSLTALHQGSSHDLMGVLIGRVELHGKAIKHANGWRAQYGRVTGVVVMATNDLIPLSHVKASVRYGIPFIFPPRRHARTRPLPA